MTNENTKIERLGKYELLEVLAEGLTGTLYRGRDTESGKGVLLKVVGPLVGQDPAFQRYFYEKWVERPSLIEHPNVLQILEAGQEADAYYVAVEDAVGERLSEKLLAGPGGTKGGPLAVDEALDIVRQVAEGVRAAHRRDMVHGHLKPSDIILTTDKMGRQLVKVVFFDLGVSPAEGMVSVFGEVMGTPKYMAPEVIRGRSPSAQSDIFALGIIAHELFTGREPFPSDNALGYLFANCQQEAVAADEAGEGVPHEIALVIRRMLQKEPARRYRSLQRVIDDLDRCVESTKTGHVEVVPHGTDSAFASEYELPQPRPRRAARRRLSVGSIVALLIAVAVLGGLLGHFLGRTGGEGPAVGKPERVTAAAGPVLAGPPTQQERVRPAPEPGQTVPVREPEILTVGREPTESTETAARKAFDKATRDWERHGQAGAYELGVAAFAAVADEYAETPYAQRAREQMGYVYAEWAHARLNQKDYADAVAKYAKALEVAPEGSRCAEIARRNLPAAMVSQAQEATKRGRYREAIGIYERMAEQFPDTLQTRAWRETRKPDLLLRLAFATWKDEQNHDEALRTFQEIVRDYSGTDEASRADKALPELYLDTVQQKLREGKLPEARQQLVELMQAYPEREAAGKAAELHAETLFGLFEKATLAGQAQDAALHFAELFGRHPSSRWTVRAARLKLSLKPEAGATLLDANAARRQLEMAQDHYDRFDFVNAIEVLRFIIRYAREDSPPAAAALSKLPAWLYESALHGYDRSSRKECERTLTELSAQFLNTLWDEKAAGALDRISGPLEGMEGMVYVPEGRFYMGTSMRELESMLRAQGLLTMGGGPEEVENLADVFGLLNETPRHIASTSAFYIDRTEVTNEQYKVFVGETGHPAPSHWRDGTHPKGEGKLPVTNVSFVDVQAYAAWAGKRLPTEAEWEKASRGVDGRRFPWGAIFNDQYCQHMRPANAGPVAVGSYGAWSSPYGCLDMIGNVQEWTSTWFAPYQASRMQSTTEATRQKVTRGGAWYQQEIAEIPVRCASRYPLDPSRANMATGFRCVRDVPKPAAPAAQ